MIINTDGGISMPSIDELATTPTASRAGYPRFSISGTAMRVNITTAAIDTPVTAAKMALPATVA
jgi:hypothetical protein